jgi:hypothetical protein
VRTKETAKAETSLCEHVCLLTPYIDDLMWTRSATLRSAKIF